MKNLDSTTIICNKIDHIMLILNLLLPPNTISSKTCIKLYSRVNSRSTMVLHCINLASSLNVIFTYMVLWNSFCRHQNSDIFLHSLVQIEWSPLTILRPFHVVCYLSRDLMKIRKPTEHNPLIILPKNCYKFGRPSLQCTKLSFC